MKDPGGTYLTLRAYAGSTFVMLEGGLSRRKTWDESRNMDTSRRRHSYDEKDKMEVWHAA